MKTDLELQQFLAKLLPEKIRISNKHGPVWIKENAVVEETEWEHICWLIEQGFTRQECYLYNDFLTSALGERNPVKGVSNWPFHIDWQQRARAILAVKGEQ